MATPSHQCFMIQLWRAFMPSDSKSVAGWWLSHPYNIMYIHWTHWKASSGRLKLGTLMHPNIPQWVGGFSTKVITLRKSRDISEIQGHQAVTPRKSSCRRSKGGGVFFLVTAACTCNIQKSDCIFTVGHCCIDSSFLARENAHQPANTVNSIHMHT